MHTPSAILLSMALACSAATQAWSGTISAVTFTGGSDPGAPPGFGVTDGWRFSIGYQVTISHLGYYDAGANGLVQNHDVGIFADTGALLATATVSSGDLLDNGFRYRPIAPLTLGVGTYRIGGYRASGADGVVSNATNFASVFQVSHLGGYFDIDAGSLAFPDTAVGAGYDPSIFGPSFRIVSPAMVPAVSFTGGTDPGRPPGAGATDGWQFSLSSPVIVGGLGYYDTGGNGLVQSHGVGIFNKAGTLLVSTTVQTGDQLENGFRYRGVAPLTLEVGTYRIGGYRASGADGVVTKVVNFTSIPEVSHQGGYFDIDAGSLAFPDTRADGSYDPSIFGPSFQVLAQGFSQDFGDAPDPLYPTLLANDGARHTVVPGVFLGAGVDIDTDGHPAMDALGDDDAGNDDEDGILFTSVIRVGETATLDVMASVAGMLNAWIDFDADGTWQDPGEQIFIDLRLNPGLNELAFDTPLLATAGPTYARFRFNTDGGLSATGAAFDGEVEDYRISVGAVPEPQTSAMLLAGLGWVGLIASRRRAGSACRLSGQARAMGSEVQVRARQQPVGVRSCHQA